MNELPVVEHLEGATDGSRSSPISCIQFGGRELGALHLPVAPRCNIRCAHCDRSHDCANKTSGGRSGVLLTPRQARAFAREALAREPRIGCVCVSGPGEPFANPVATLETLALIREEYPELPLFTATNGLCAVEHVEDLRALGVRLCIVTVNAIEPSVVERLVEWVRGPDGITTGEEAARFLVSRQLASIRALSSAEVTVRV